MNLAIGGGVGALTADKMPPDASQKIHMDSVEQPTIQMMAVLRESMMILITRGQTGTAAATTIRLRPTTTSIAGAAPVPADACHGGQRQFLRESYGIPYGRIAETELSIQVVTIQTDAECQQAAAANCPTIEDGICGSADNITDGCVSGSWLDVPGDPGWTCRGVGGGADASCPDGPPTCTYICNLATQEDIIGGNPATWLMGGGCSDGTNEDVSFHLSTAECANRMAAFCSPVTHWPYGVNQDYPSSTCCSGPGCPFDPRPELQNVSGTCGSDDTIPDGCVDGGYVDIPGPTWTCEGNGTGTDATCP